MGQPTPPAPPAPPPADPPPAPAPAPAPANGPPADPAAELARMQGVLAEERRQRQQAEQALAKAQQAGMSDQEKALNEARAEGRTEAVKAAGIRVAAAEFRAAAAGKLADPAAALEVLDLTKFVGDDGDVNRRGLVALVDKLAAALPVPVTPPGHVPAGPHGAPPSDDFLRAGFANPQ